jgi:hypothetical protein
VKLTVCTKCVVMDQYRYEAARLRNQDDSPTMAVDDTKEHLDG